ncbi:MAG TPA: glycosyltransferase family 4 protein [Candidatus Nitrosopolaris sp.]|nr:glycosyltransferase family 4 protein [Candidatus Nitrosopolaris sp.]
MRLLFINSNRSPNYGGVERWMLDAALGLGARGHTCILLGRPGSPWLAHATRLGIRVRGDIRGTWVARVLRVAAAMRIERPDLVITKAKKAARMAALGRAAGGGGRVALFLGATHELDRRWWIDRFTWRHVDAGVVVAHGEKRWYLDAGFGPPDKLHVLWKGINIARFDLAPPRAAATRAALGLAPHELAIGTVGRLAWQKGIGDLLDAVPAVRSRCPSARFFVIGGGRDADAVAKAAAALDGSVTLLGQRDDVPELLAALDIVVLSSRREAMAQATLEGMAVGRPVISTTTIGADEAIEDGVSGLLVPVGDPQALAEAIVGLAADPARRAVLGEAARRRIGEHFTSAHTLDRSEAVFRAIVDAVAPVAG